MTLNLIHNDTPRPYPASLGRSRYVVIFVNSASPLQGTYGSREKSEFANLAVIKRFVADMGVPRAFRTYNGSEYLNGPIVDFCNNIGIWREFTTPYTL